MKKLAQLLTKYIVSKGIVADSEASVYAYGFQMGLELLFNLIVSIIIALILDMLPEAAIFFIVFIPIRSYAGGFHFNSYFWCFLLSIITYWFVLYFSQFLSLEIGLQVSINIVLLSVIYLLFPVQNVRRILDTDEKKYFAKKLRWLLVGNHILNIGLGYWKCKSLHNVMSLTLVLIVITMVVGKITYWLSDKKEV